MNPPGRGIENMEVQLSINVRYKFKEKYNCVKGVSLRSDSKTRLKLNEAQVVTERLRRFDLLEAKTHISKHS